MSDEGNKTFLLKAKKEIEQKIKSETQQLSKVKKENEELTRSKMGYDNFYESLSNFIIESIEDFHVTEDDLPQYFKENIGETYENYVQIRVDALNEIDALNNYIDHCKREISSNKRTLKFYRSQYLDSDFFDECLPLVVLYQDKIDTYNENIQLTEDIIKKLGEISDKLVGWN